MATFKTIPKLDSLATTFESVGSQWRLPVERGAEGRGFERSVGRLFDDGAMQARRANHPVAALPRRLAEDLDVAGSAIKNTHALHAVGGRADAIDHAVPDLRFALFAASRLIVVFPFGLGGVARLASSRGPQVQEIVSHT